MGIVLLVATEGNKNISEGWNVFFNQSGITDVFFNPLLPEFFFPPFFRTCLKIGSYRLPTHSRDALWNFFFF